MDNADNNPAPAQDDNTQAPVPPAPADDPALTPPTNDQPFGGDAAAAPQDPAGTDGGDGSAVPGADPTPDLPTVPPAQPEDEGTPAEGDDAADGTPSAV